MHDSIGKLLNKLSTKYNFILIGDFNSEMHDSIRELLNKLSTKYDNFILIGDFNSEMQDSIRELIKQVIYKITLSSLETLIHEINY